MFKLQSIPELNMDLFQSGFSLKHVEIQIIPELLLFIEFMCHLSHPEITLGGLQILKLVYIKIIKQ